MEWEFEVWQDGQRVAAGFGSDRYFMEREAFRYFNQYLQDGPARLMFGNPPLPSHGKDEG